MTPAALAIESGEITLAGCRPRSERVEAAHVEPEVRDEAWFARLYDKTFDTVYHFARTLVREHATAEDVVSDAYLKAWRARASYSGRGSALSWLMTITRNCAMDHMRARRPQVSLELFEGFGEQEEVEEEQFLSEADAAAIRDAVTQLSEEHQTVIRMRFFEGASHDVIATRLGKTPTAVRQIQYRALVQLRRYLEEEADAR